MKKKYTIIDGQQRLTTMSIIILAALNNLKRLVTEGNDSVDNQKRREVIHAQFIRQIDYATLVSYNKLKLSRHNESFYKNFLVPISNIPARGLNSSEKLMKRCFEYFSDKIKRHYSQDGKIIAEFIQNMADKFFFTVIVVNDDLNAFKVFETLNARGVRLSLTDLVKNYLLSLLEKDQGEAEIERCEDLWEDIINILKEEQFPEFLRYYWNGRNNLIRKEGLFKAIKQKITNKKDVMKFISNLRHSADIYRALQDSKDEFWKNNNKQIKEYLYELKLFEVKQPLSLLMLAYERLAEEDFEKLLRICSVITLRYNVIGAGNPNEQESVYNKVALNIFINNSWQKNDFFKVYPDDEKFQHEFADKSFNLNSRNKNKIKYILKILEQQNSSSYIDETPLTIEHILPQNPECWSEWGFEEEQATRVISRLGNLTLLEESLNADACAKNFATKKEIYKKSKIPLTKSIADLSTWDEEAIINRQKAMAKKAKTIWHF